MINVGILGTGFGKTHAEIYKKIEGINISCIWGRNEEKLRQIENELDIETTTDIEAVIGNSEIDLLDICLPTELHAKYAIEGLKNKKHIFCEMPIAYSLSEANEIQRAADQYGKHVFVDLFTKFSSPHKYAIDLVKNNTIGKPLVFHAYNETEHKWGDLSFKKGIFTFYINNIDFLLEIMGMPTKLFSSGYEKGEGSFISTVFNYENSFASILCNSLLPKNSPFGIGYNIIGENGSIVMKCSYGDVCEESIILNTNGNNEKVEFVSEDDYESVINHVKNCLIKNERSSFLDIENAIQSLSLAEKTYESIKSNLVQEV